ncbi:MAG: twin-arginine translocase TatA/TatE family subunit [Actinomycetota bacterium]
MFNIGAGEMIVIALILLMAVGPEQLPGLIRRVGRTVSEVRGMTEGLRAEFMSGLEEIERATDPEAWAAGGNEPTKVKPRSERNPVVPRGGTTDTEDEESGSSSDEDTDNEAPADGQIDTPEPAFPEAGEPVADTDAPAPADFTVATWDGSARKNPTEPQDKTAADATAGAAVDPVDTSTNGATDSPDVASAADETNLAEPDEANPAKLDESDPADADEANPAELDEPDPAEAYEANPAEPDETEEPA